jgi:hypothetical protein
MRQQHKNARSFRQIVAAVEDQNADRLIARARTANRLAKMSGGTPRRTAYAIKARALTCLAERFPDRVCVVLDYDAPGFVLVTFTRNRSGLHAPASLFSQPMSVTRAA